MSLFRHREIYRSDVIRLVRERRKRRPRPHRLDEFPAGYSSAGCSPAEPASASPAVDHSALQSSCQSIAFHRTANSVLTVCLSPGARPKALGTAPPCSVPACGDKTGGGDYDKQRRLAACSPQPCEQPGKLWPQDQLCPFPNRHSYLKITRTKPYLQAVRLFITQ